VVRKIAPYKTCRTRDCHPLDCARNDIIVEEVGGDKGVAAFDVGGEVGECAFVEEAVLVFNGLGVFSFEHFEQERKLCDLDGLGVDIDAEDVVQEDSFLFGDGEEVVAGAAYSANAKPLWMSSYNGPGSTCTDFSRLRVLEIKSLSD
jgi:hypothetical protein